MNMTDKEKVIKGAEEILSYVLPDEKDTSGTMVKVGWVRDVLAILKEQEANEPIHIYEEYPEHDWKRKENGEIDDFAFDGDYHNGPYCKRCHYSFCIFCDPNGWNKEPCVIDEYKCPKCGRYISKNTKFCSKCGQAVKWND